MPPTADMLAGVNHLVDSAQHTEPNAEPTIETHSNTRRYPTRANRMSWQQRAERQAYHVKVKTALKSYKKSGLIAMIKELRSVALDKEAIVPVNLRTYNKKRLKKIITSSLFFKENFSKATRENY